MAILRQKRCYAVCMSRVVQTESVQTLPKAGALCPQMVRCGKPECRCARGELHGPYYYIFWRERGRLRKRYVRMTDVGEVRAALAEWRRLHPPVSRARQELAELHRLLRQLDALGVE